MAGGYTSLHGTVGMPIPGYLLWHHIEVWEHLIYLYVQVPGFFIFPLTLNYHKLILSKYELIKYPNDLHILLINKYLLERQPFHFFEICNKAVFNIQYHLPDYPQVNRFS